MPGAIVTMGSMHICPMCTGTVPHVGGPVIGPGAPNVLINGKPAAIMGDMCTCVGPPSSICMGEASVLINGTPAVAMGAITNHGGTVTMGEPNVMISVAVPIPSATVPISQIQFPDISFEAKALAATIGELENMELAEANMQTLSDTAEAELPRRIYNVRMQNADGQKITSENIKNTVNVVASVMGIDDGETVTFQLKKKTEEADTFVELTGTVQDKQVVVEWDVDENQFKTGDNV